MRLMRDGDRDVGDGTLPGVGTAAPARPSSPVITGGTTATAPPAPTVASMADARAVKQRLATDPTLPGTAVANADKPGAAPADKAARHRLATDPTLASDGSDESDARGLGETLAGPHIAADLPALQRIDDTAYAIGEELARGGMGKILFARDRRLRRDVVIKVTHREPGKIDPRFEREALITARLQHPSIVRVYDAGVLGDGRAFYAMERVRGRSLEASRLACSCLPDAATLARSKQTRELDHILAATFGLWDLVLPANKKFRPRPTSG